MPMCSPVLITVTAHFDVVQYAVASKRRCPWVSLWDPSLCNFSTWLFYIYLLLRNRLFPNVRNCCPAKHWQVHTAHCTLYTVNWTLHAAHCTLHTSHFTLHTAHCTLHTSHFTLHSAYSTPNTLNSSPHIWIIHTKHSPTEQWTLGEIGAKPTSSEWRQNVDRPRDFTTSQGAACIVMIKTVV